METVTDTPALTPEPILLEPREPVAPVAKKALEDLTESERLDWRMTGKKPDAAPVDAVESEALEPATAPAQARTVSKRQQDINDRIRQSVEAATRDAHAEIQRLQSLIPQAAPVSPQAPATDAEPTLDQFDTYEKFVKAQARWEARQEFREQQTAVARQQATQREQHALQQSATAFADRTAKAREKYPDYDAKVAPLAARMVPGQGDPIADRVFRSPVSGDLLHLFVSEPTVLPALIASVRGLSDQQAREEIFAQIGRLEARFDASTAPAPAALSPKTITSAPAPPFTLGSRPGDAADPVTAALKRRDTGAYIRAMNARELAATKR